MAHILPSNYPSQQMSLSLENARRLPLSDSTGNTQYATLASDIFRAEKRLQPLENIASKFTLPCLPSQPSSQSQAFSIAQDIHNRRASTRSQRSRRCRNPVAESSQYRAYRARQPKEGDDQTWPPELEDAFLDALLDVPKMGRRKFSLNGKPHGRNELIALYLWIAHLESLPPGAQPDESRRRTRKQVSSHIQVLRGFMRDHPACSRLFPLKGAGPKNGFEDSFKNDPCLVALAQHRLPHRRSSQRPASPPVIRPHLFDIYMTVPASDNESKRIHAYSEPDLRNLGRNNLEDSLPNWRKQFPQIEHALGANELDCGVIHVEASLALRNGKSPENAELWGRFEIVIPANEDRLKWRCMQTLHKHKDLYGALDMDPPIVNKMYPLNVDRFEEGTGPIMRVAFPALPWAHALGKLSDLQEQFEEAMREGGHYPIQMTARQYIDQITMYQEIFSSAGDGHGWKKRAIIAWTFTKAKQGERGQTTWRYLDPAPPRRAIFSPHPGHHQELQATMSDNFSNMYQTPPLSIHPVHYDSLLNGLATPPHTQSGVLQSSFAQYYAPQQDLVPDNMSFMSNNTQDSDDTLADQHQAAHQMNHFLDNDPVSMHSFEQQSNMWQVPHNVGGAFEGDNTYLAPYTSMAPNASAVHVWDTAAGEGPKHHGWSGHESDYAYETHRLGLRFK